MPQSASSGIRHWIRFLKFLHELTTSRRSRHARARCHLPREPVTHCDPSRLATDQHVGRPGEIAAAKKFHVEICRSSIRYKSARSIAQREQIRSVCGNARYLNTAAATWVPVAGIAQRRAVNWTLTLPLGATLSEIKRQQHQRLHLPSAHVSSWVTEPVICMRRGEPSRMISSTILRFTVNNTWETKGLRPPVSPAARPNAI